MQWTIAGINFGVVDIVVLVVIMAGAVSGCVSGFSRSLTKVAGFVIAMPIAMLFTKEASAYLIQHMGQIDPLPACLLSFVALSLIVYVLVSLVGAVLSHIMNSNTLFSVVDSLLGFAWGVLCAGLIVFAVLSILTKQSFINFQEVAQHSYVINEFINPVFSQVSDTLLEAFNGF